MPVAINDLSKTKISHTHLKSIVRLVFQKTKKDLKKYQLSIALVDNQTIRQLNKKYRNKNKTTTVLSFAYSAHSGEVILAVNEIKKISRKNKIIFTHNFKRYLVHGLLHLCGYGHQKKEQARKMEKMEKLILID